MQTYTIASNSCPVSIHAIDDAMDRHIKFPGKSKFAVVLASYYGGRGYTTHRDEQAAIAKSQSLGKQEYSHKIIDLEGNEYDINPRGELEIVHYSGQI